MRVMLINPPRYKGTYVVREERCAGLTFTSLIPPLGLACTTSYLRENGHEVNLIDANGEDRDMKYLEKKMNSWSPDLVVLKTSPGTMKPDIKLATIAKRVNKDIVVALDDSIVSATMPGKVLTIFPDLDMIIRGEPELTTLNVCNALEREDSLKKVGGIAYRDKNGIHVTRDGERIKDLDSLPFPAYDFLPMKKYFSVTFAKKKPWTTMMSSRGCPFNCIYCIVGGATVWRGYGKAPRFRTPKNVVDEMEMLAYNHGVKDIEFWDENITMNKKRMMEICNELIKRDLPVVWSCNTRADTVDREMLVHMKRAKCWNNVYGVESGSQKILDATKKQITLEKIRETFDLTRKVGICASASFMVGLPGETWETVKQTLKFANEIRPDFAQFGICTPYPGTAMEEMARRKGWIKGFEVDKYDPLLECLGESTIMNMDTMGPDEIVRAQQYLVRNYYFRPGVLLRTAWNAKSLAKINFLMRSAKYLFKRAS